MNLFNNYGVLKSGILTSALEYLEANPEVKSFIIGESGGVDSALCTALARTVAKTRPIQIIAASIPISTNKPAEISRAADVGRLFADEFIEKDMTEEFDTLVACIEPTLHMKLLTSQELTHVEKVRLGNIKARLRMIFLYNLAAANQGLVLSTDNFTEYYMGFWTLHGDVGDLGFIQQLWKTEVYGLTEYLAEELGGKEKDALMACVNAKPTDGLGVSNSDLDQLLPGFESDDWRAGYAAVDRVIIDRLAKEHAFPPDHPVNRRYDASMFKRANPVSFKRELLTWIYNSK